MNVISLNKDPEREEESLLNSLVPIDLVVVRDCSLISITPMYKRKKQGDPIVIPVENARALARALELAVDPNQRMYEKAGMFLCEPDDPDNPDFTLRDVVDRIIDFDGDGETPIENIDGVVLWEKMSSNITVDEFLEMIEYGS